MPNLVSVRGPHARGPMDNIRVQWNMGNSCNYECEYCPSILHDGSKPWLPLESYLTTIERLSQHYNDMGKRVDYELIGGEVTVIPGFEDIIRKISEYNTHNVVFTNGSRTVKWWSKAKHYMDGVVLTFHPDSQDKQHIIDVPKKFLKDKLNINVNEDPVIQINDKTILETIQKFQIDKKELNVLLGIGGSGHTKRIPSKTFLEVIDKISKIKKCKFFLATGKNEEEQIILREIQSSKFENLCHPLDNFSIKEVLPIIKCCDLSICNDSSFSHLSAALGIKTITLMADTPLIYGNYSSNMFPIIPDGEKTVTHDTLGREKINPQKIFEKIIEIIN